MYYVYSMYSVYSMPSVYSMYPVYILYSVYCQFYSLERFPDLILTKPILGRTENGRKTESKLEASGVTTGRPKNDRMVKIGVTDCEIKTKNFLIHFSWHHNPGAEHQDGGDNIFL